MTGVHTGCRQAISQLKVGHQGSHLPRQTLRGALTKGLIDRQVGLDDEHGGTSHLGLLKDMTPLPVQDTVDATNHLFRTLPGEDKLSALWGKEAAERPQGRPQDGCPQDGALTWISTR